MLVLGPDFEYQGRKSMLEKSRGPDSLSLEIKEGEIAVKFSKHKLDLDRKK